MQTRVECSPPSTKPQCPQTISIFYISIQFSTYSFVILFLNTKTKLNYCTQEEDCVQTIIKINAETMIWVSGKLRPDDNWKATMSGEKG